MIPALTLSGCAFPPGQVASDVVASPAASPAGQVSRVPQIRVAPVTQATATPPGSPTPSVTASATAARTSTRTPTATATATPTVELSPTATFEPTPDGEARTLKVPILMYHYVSQAPADADVYRQDLSVTPERFAEHLRYLRDAGYTAITLDDLLYALAQGRPLPAKPIALTFDDGYSDNYDNAFPLLREAGFVGTFFIMTDLVTDGATGYLTWPQVQEMAAAGQQFGSHGRQDHRSLRGRSTDYLVWVALGTKEAIEEHLGYQPRWVAYPSGEYDDQTIAVFRSAGYWGGLTIQQGTEHTLDDIFELHRIRIRSSHTTDDLARLLALEW